MSVHHALSLIRPIGLAEPTLTASRRPWRARTARKAFFVAFDYTPDALREIDAFFRKSGKVIMTLTVREILDEEIAKKLA
jgi:hypothetical protein